MNPTRIEGIKSRLSQIRDANLRSDVEWMAETIERQEAQLERAARMVTGVLV